MKLMGRNVIITGASQGFGFAVAKMFVSEGANIAICARDAQQLSQAKRELEQVAKGKIKIIAQVTDISKPNEIDSFVKAALSEMGSVDTLIANAGTYGPKGAVEEIDWEEWSNAIDINLKGTVMTCKAVLPFFKQQQYGKIILLSGGGATKPMPFLSAYAASKAAVVRFAETLAEEVKSFHIDVNAVAPGALNTRLLDEVLQAGPEKVGATFYQQSLKQKTQGGTELEVGSSLCVYLASSESDGITGKLISAVWDPWKSLTQYKNELIDSDIYTLRRIVPKDRGKNWDES
jgi:NAD(P)-dependent dehydrogenase (short-subunit alcohol dehydrogenase family)